MGAIGAAMLAQEHVLHENMAPNLILASLFLCFFSKQLAINL